jgi:hypothetical protein
VYVERGTYGRLQGRYARKEEYMWKRIVVEWRMNTTVTQVTSVGNVACRGCRKAGQKSERELPEKERI